MTKKVSDIIAKDAKSVIKSAVIIDAYKLMRTARELSDTYEKNAHVTSKYVHATSKGHECIQIALGMQLKPQDWVAPYYRDDAMLLAMGLTPLELMLQLLAKKDDPFSGGRTYYSHPSLKRADIPNIPHQSSATGMQAIPTTGIAMGLQYRETTGLDKYKDYSEKPVVVCSFGDASVTEGEVSEAFHMAALKQLPILYLVQDNGWDISANAEEIHIQTAYEYAHGFKGLEALTIDGTDFNLCYNTIKEIFDVIRKERKPFILHATVPLLNHHTSGVRMEWYRDDLKEHKKRDPMLKLEELLGNNLLSAKEKDTIDEQIINEVAESYNKAISAPDPSPTDLLKHTYAPTTITEEVGVREPKGKEAVVMVDCALIAVRELLQKHPECLLYGQDVGARLGGVFREAATLAQEFGEHRVFNTPIQEAFIIGSTVGMSAVRLKPIVEVQFADYIWPGLNQLFSELSRSNYLSNGKWPVSAVIRVPVGCYGSGGPYHSSSVESVVANITGVKIAYPSNGADIKGLMKAAFYDPNPIVIFEHKGLYWSKVKGTEGARTIEPDDNYIIPFGKGRFVTRVIDKIALQGEGVTVVTYGRGVYWALEASKKIPGKVEIIDLRTLVPWDKEMVFSSVKKTGRALVLTEEPSDNSYTPSIAAHIGQECFEYLDAPVAMMGSANTPAVPLNSLLELEYLPNAEKVFKKLTSILDY